MRQNKWINLGLGLACIATALLTTPLIVMQAIVGIALALFGCSFLISFFEEG